MLRSRYFALLAAIAALAFPAASLAQSAGDDQYQDPLAGQPSGNGGGSQSSGSNSGGSSSGSGTAPAATPSTASGGSEGTAPQASAAAKTQSGELPRTGFDVLLTVELGLALLLTGVVAQRTLVLRDRREQR